MEIVVREFEESDREALRALFVASRDGAFVWASPGTHKLEDFDVSTDGEQVLVALCGRAPVGFASIWIQDSFLHNLFVHPAFQRRGVGKALLASCERYFSRNPTLKCIKANGDARRFYESHGWGVRIEGEGVDGPYLLMERVRPRPSLRGADCARP